MRCGVCSDLTERDRPPSSSHDDISLLTPGVIDISAVSGHRQLTDVYLLALAVAHDLRFVTLDRGVSMEAVSGADDTHLAVI